MVEKINREKKQNIDIGSLVFVKTHNNMDLNSFYKWIQNPIQITPTMPFGGGTISNQGSTWWTNDSTTTDNVQFGKDPNTFSTNEDHDPYGSGVYQEYKYQNIIEDCKITPNELRSLLNLYSEYNSNQNTGGNNSPSDLGMAHLGNSSKHTKYYKYKTKKSTNKTKRNNSVSANTFNKNYITNSSNTNNMINISPNSIGSTTNIKIDAEYYAKGYKTIEDYFNGLATEVKQEEQYSQEDLENLPDINGPVAIGKPFPGIVVDKFVPKLKTEKGEEVTVPMPGSLLGNPLGEDDEFVLYKVLIGEKNCLWFTKQDIDLANIEDGDE